jgi:hypothetical protein
VSTPLALARIHRGQFRGAEIPGWRTWVGEADGFTDRYHLHLHTISELRKRSRMVPPAATLSTICTCARAPVPPIPRTAMYRPVQAGKPQAEARPARFPPPGYNPRASTTGPDSPHARHAQALNQDSKPVHLPPTPDAPSMYFSQARATGQRREPRDRSTRRKHIRSLPVSKRTTHDAKSRSARLVAQIRGFCAR